MAKIELTLGAQWNNLTHYHKHGIAHLRKVTAPIDPTPFEQYVDGEIHRVFLASLGPKGFIIPHVDAGPFHERWHVALEPAGFYWEEDEGYIYPEEGQVFRVNHHRLHAVGNPTDIERIHAIIDMKKMVDVPNRGLIIEGMIPEIQELINELD